MFATGTCDRRRQTSLVRDRLVCTRGKLIGRWADWPKRRKAGGRCQDDPPAKRIDLV